MVLRRKLCDSNSLPAVDTEAEYKGVTRPEMVQGHSSLWSFRAGLCPTLHFLIGRDQQRRQPGQGRAVSGSPEA